MRIRILPYRQGSASAKKLAEAVNGRVLRLTGSTFVPRSSDVLINWGCTDESKVTGFIGVVLNRPIAITAASNKRRFFMKMREAGLSNIIPNFWLNREDIPANAYPIVCRTVLAGHSGEGIVIAFRPEELVAAPLYVKYEKKKDEYRIHIGRTYDERRTQIIVAQRKARRLDYSNPNWQVRNHQNGFIYARSDVSPPDIVIAAAEAALLATDLDFGAVDVIYNAEKGNAYVLEINTAPGLEGQTVTDYGNFFLS